MTLPLSDFVSITVQVSPQAVQPPTFNQALIVGNSAVIPSYGVNSRCRKYSGGSSILTAMVADGFLTTSPEYLAASFFVSNGGYTLWVGRQDATAIEADNVHVGNAGTGYVVGDQVTAVQAGATNGVFKVTAIGAGGSVTAIAPVTLGTGYSVATALATTGGTGINLELDITAIGETPLQAVQACRIASSDWYLFTVQGSADADNVAMTQWAQTASPVCQNFFQTASDSARDGVAGNIFTTLKTGTYNRYQGVYTTNQSGAAPNNAYFAAALMGLAMGLNTGLANSYFTLTNKTIKGMTVEPLTQTQVDTINSNNGNTYANYGNSYNSYSPGITGSGQYFDNILGIDMLVADLQFGLANALTLYNAIGQNDSGQCILLHSANVACDKSVTRGFLSNGTWQGSPVLGLQAGMPINGYFNQSPSYASLGTKPANRASAPIYVAVQQTEAVQQVVISAFVQQ